MHVALLATAGNLVVPALLPAVGNLAFIAMFSALHSRACGMRFTKWTPCEAC
jgi:hypothetical protein